MAVELRKRLLAANYDPVTTKEALHQLLNSDQTRIQFDLAPVRNTMDGTQELTWISEDGLQIIFLSDDPLNQVVRIDISAHDSETSENLSKAIVSVVPVADFQGELLLARYSEAIDLENTLVRLGQMAPVRIDTDSLNVLIDRALDSSDSGVRRAATYVAFLVQGPEMLQRLARALTQEQDAELIELMEYTLRATDSEQGPTTKFL